MLKIFSFTEVEYGRDYAVADSDMFHDIGQYT